MPKIKTHKGAAKRFRITKNGKVLRNTVGVGHLRRRKRKSARRAGRRVIVDGNASTLKLIKRATAGQANKRSGHKNTSRG